MPSPRLPRRDRLAFRVLGLLTGETEGAFAIGGLVVLAIVVVLVVALHSPAWPALLLLR